MQRNIKLSLITPCHNSYAFIDNCLESIKNQSVDLKDIEFILVDDASTDDGKTVGKLEAFSREVPNAMVIKLEVNKKQGGARNTALKHVTGDYVGFLDSDDHITADYCEKLLSLAYETDADILQFGHYEYIIDENGNPQIIREEKWQPKTVIIEDNETRRDFIMFGGMSPGHWDKIYKRSLLEEAGVHFGENVIYEEPLFTYPLQYYVKKYVATDGIYHFNYLRGDSTMRKNMCDAGTIYDHMSQCIELLDFMQKSPFYEDFREEINFKFYHSYIMESLIFAGKYGYTIDIKKYEEMRKVLFSRTKRPFENKYVRPGSLYYTVNDILMRNNMNQEALNDVISAMGDIG